MITCDLFVLQVRALTEVLTAGKSPANKQSSAIYLTGLSNITCTSVLELKQHADSAILLYSHRLWSGLSNIIVNRPRQKGTYSAAVQIHFYTIFVARTLLSIQ